MSEKDELADLDAELADLDIDNDYNLWTSFRSRRSMGGDSRNDSVITEDNDDDNEEEDPSQLELDDLEKWKARLAREEVFSNKYKPDAREAREVENLISFLGMQKTYLFEKQDIKWKTMMELDNIILKRGPILCNGQERELVLLSHGFVLAKVTEPPKGLFGTRIARTYEQCELYEHVEYLRSVPVYVQVEIWIQQEQEEERAAFEVNEEGVVVEETVPEEQEEPTEGKDKEKEDLDDHVDNIEGGTTHVVDEDVQDGSGSDDRQDEDASQEGEDEASPEARAEEEESLPEVQADEDEASSEMQANEEDASPEVQANEEESDIEEVSPEEKSDLAISDVKSEEEHEAIHDNKEPEENTIVLEENHDEKSASEERGQEHDAKGDSDDEEEAIEKENQGEEDAKDSSDKDVNVTSERRGLFSFIKSPSEKKGAPEEKDVSDQDDVKDASEKETNDASERRNLFSFMKSPSKDTGAQEEEDVSEQHDAKDTSEKEVNDASERRNLFSFMKSPSKDSGAQEDNAVDEEYDAKQNSDRELSVSERRGLFSFMKAGTEKTETSEEDVVKDQEAVKEEKEPIRVMREEERYCFVIKTESQEFNFQCETLVHKEAWLEAWEKILIEKRSRSKTARNRERGWQYNIIQASLCAAAITGLEELLCDEWLDNKNELDSYNKFAPLHYATRVNHMHIMDYLLRNGADPEVQDSDGRTPMYYAQQYELGAAQSLLLDYGAKRSTLSEIEERGELFKGAHEVAEARAAAKEEEESESNRLKAHQDAALSAKGTMAQNMNDLRIRGEKINDLAEKTATLEANVATYGDLAKKMKQKAKKKKWYNVR